MLRRSDDAERKASALEPRRCALALYWSDGPSSRISGGGASSEGLGFAWVSSSTIPSNLATGSGSFGSCANPNAGYAVIADTNDPSSSAVPYLGIFDMKTCKKLAASAKEPTLVDGNWHTVHVSLAQTGALSVQLDGTQAMSVTLASFTPFAHCARDFIAAQHRAPSSGTCQRV